MSGTGTGVGGIAGGGGAPVGIAAEVYSTERSIRAVINHLALRERLSYIEPSWNSSLVSVNAETLLSEQKRDTLRFSSATSI